MAIRSAVMPKRSRTPKDVNVVAAEILKAATELKKNPAATDLGRSKGLNHLSAKKRREIAKKAAQSRWAKR
jgi:hypothetical protein